MLVRPYGDHCIETNSFQDLPNVHGVVLAEIEKDDDIGDKDEAYLKALRDLVISGDFVGDLREVVPGKEYEIKAKLLKDKSFYVSLDMAVGKYKVILLKKWQVEFNKNK